MRHYFLLLAGLVLTVAIQAQNTANDTLIIFGTVKQAQDSSPIPAITVHAVDVNDPSHVLQATIRDNGRYELKITEERTYMINYSAPQFLNKKVQVEVAGPTAEQWKGGYGMNIDITLVPFSSGHDPALYEEPFGIARFNTDSARYDWDLAHTKARVDQIKKATGKP